MFGRKPKILIDIETDPDITVSGNFTEYYKLLEKQLKYLQDITTYSLNPNVWQ